MRRTLSFYPVITNRYIAFKHLYQTVQSVTSTKKDSSHEPTIHKVTRKSREELPFLDYLKEIKVPEEALSLFHQYQQRVSRYHYPFYSSLI
ncbi:hypothetical protein Bca52824_006710 [Brassica carinata]|uniref:Uncharacterized protein n=1 Tax=Brassica carinata TaxID=52824 RepID=A0A8X8B7F8_BRACI|nr:hypothetical protein Bca52824_006710 [Brassica carinata]